MTRALQVLDILQRLGALVLRALRDGHPERVDRIIPAEMFTSLERHLADELARGRWGAPDPAPTEPEQP